MNSRASSQRPDLFNDDSELAMILKVLAAFPRTLSPDPTFGLSTNSIRAMSPCITSRSRYGLM
jgi:hypothetical protein